MEDNENLKKQEVEDDDTLVGIAKKEFKRLWRIVFFLMFLIIILTICCPNFFDIMLDYFISLYHIISEKIIKIFPHAQRIDRSFADFLILFLFILLVAYKIYKKQIKYENSFYVCQNCFYIAKMINKKQRILLMVSLFLISLLIILSIAYLLTGNLFLAKLLLVMILVSPILPIIIVLTASSTGKAKCPKCGGIMYPINSPRGRRIYEANKKNIDEQILLYRSKNP